MLSLLSMVSVKHMLKHGPLHLGLQFSLFKAMPEATPMSFEHGVKT